MPSPWIDVSVPLKTGMVHWPGDPAASIVRVRSLERGDNCTLSAIDMVTHTGTHMDAPAHFIRGGLTLDKMPLDAVVGRARVIGIQARDCIRPEHLAGHRIRAGERLLFKTRNSARCWKQDAFVEDFVYISADAARWSGRAGGSRAVLPGRVCAVGADLPSRCPCRRWAFTVTCRPCERSPSS